jgi:hypothetical protein
MKNNDLGPLIREAFSAPEPEMKQSFLKNLKPREVSTPEVVLQQFAYIRIPVWLFAGFIMLIVVTASLFRFENVENFMTVCMPFAAAISVLETRRSARFGMSELEMATRFSLRTVVLARMTALGILAAVELLVCAPAIAASFGRSLLITGSRILIPYLLTMVSGLAVERSPLGRRTGYLSLVIAAAVSVLVFLVDNLDSRTLLLYLNMLKHWGVALVFVLLSLTVFEQWKTIHHVEALA